MFIGVWRLLSFIAAAASGICWCWFKVGGSTGTGRHVERPWPMCYIVKCLFCRSGLWLSTSSRLWRWLGFRFASVPTLPPVCVSTIDGGFRSGWLQGPPRDLFVTFYYLVFFLQSILNTCHVLVFLIVSACMCSCTSLID